MFDKMLSAAVEGFTKARRSNRINRMDGITPVDPRLANQVSHLSDHLLHDIGLDRSR